MALMTETRKYSCVVCSHSSIIQTRVEQSVDVGEGDFPCHGNYKVWFGSLLAGHPEAPWFDPLVASATEGKSKPPYGGICENCLKTEVVKRLLPYLTFVEGSVL